MILHVPLYLSIYLFINLILSVISRSLIDIADPYWKKNEDPPNMNFFKVIMIGSTLIISNKLFYVLGYTNGFIHAIILGRSKLKPISNRVYFIFTNIILPIIKIFIFLPVLIYGTISELRFKYSNKGDK